jgi:hypothetical protein
VPSAVRDRAVSLTAQDFHVVFEADRSAVATFTLHRLDRSQRPALLPGEPTNLSGRHATTTQQRASVLRAHYAQQNAAGFVRRVRVVDPPIPQSLRRELDAVALHADAGAHIRTVTTAQVACWERDRPLPDLLTLSGRYTYQLWRNSDGAVVRVHRTDNAEMASQWRYLIDDLYERGEDAVATWRRLCTVEPATGHLPACGHLAEQTHQALVPQPRQAQAAPVQAAPIAWPTDEIAATTGQGRW